MDITQNHCEKQLKNILVCRLIMSYNEQEFKDNSSGRGVTPHRRYSPRPMETWLNRCDSGTDSIVWMREDDSNMEAWLQNHVISGLKDKISGSPESEIFLISQEIVSILTDPYIFPEFNFCSKSISLLFWRKKKWKRKNGVHRK